MSVSQSRPVVEFDHHSSAFAADPASAYRLLRQTCPVAWTEAHGGYWIPTRYEDISRIAHDDELFSSARGPHGGEGTAFIIPKRPGELQLPIELDPPASVPYRRLLNPVLTRPAVDRLRPLISRITTETIDRFVQAGEADLIGDFANPVPALVTLVWLGLGAGDWPQFSGPLHDIFASPPGSDRMRRGERGLDHVHNRIRAVLRQRRAAPADDIVSYLVASEIDGRPLTDDEVHSLVFLVIVGGVDTTTSLTGQALVYLAEHPEQRALLAADPVLLTGATEEFLRLFAPSQSMARTVTTDAEIGGCGVHGGDRVLVPWIAANLDPDAFDDPETADLRRSHNRHLSFGAGTHRCAGNHLARAMFREMVSQILERIGDYEVCVEQLVSYPSQGNQTGWDTVPVRFTPGPALRPAAEARDVTRW